MGIRISNGRTKREWSKLASAGAEIVTQACGLGKDGYSGAAAAFFRLVESLRGEDGIELRAAKLVMETLTYAVSGTLTTASLGRRAQRAEAEL